MRTSQRMPQERLRSRLTETELAVLDSLMSGRELDAQISIMLHNLGILQHRFNSTGECGEELKAMHGQVVDSIHALQKEREKIGELIDLVPDSMCRMVMKARCLTFKTWLQIAMMLSIDESTARRRFEKGLKILAVIAESSFDELPEEQ